MERERDEDEEKAEREAIEATGDPDEASDEEVERTSGPEQNRDGKPYPPIERAQAVYGDTDMDPNRDDQRSAHHAESDEHL